VDFHRLLHNGGMFLYPSIVNHADASKNKPEGKLRLLYEAAVVAFMAHEAGGMAVDENGNNLLDVVPTDRHQRSALYVGNKEMVEAISEVLKSRT
jgi:fructose-1,6-bisphosphatase I